jgi:hypothetical protein
MRAAAVALLLACVSSGGASGAMARHGSRDDDGAAGTTRSGRTTATSAWLPAPTPPSQLPAKADGWLAWLDSRLPPEARTAALLKAMNHTEKTHLLHGGHKTNCTEGSEMELRTCYAGFIPANERLKIPSLRLEDGPSGVADHAVNVTKWPGDFSHRR